MLRWSYPSRALALAAALAAVPLGCASRTLPARFPSSAAASPASPAAPSVLVTGALTSEPPLPGEPVTDWPGLRAEDTASAAHAGHGGHRGH